MTNPNTDKVSLAWRRLSDYNGCVPVLLLSDNGARQYFDEVIPVQDKARMEFFDDVTHFMDLSSIPENPKSEANHDL